MYRFVRWFQSPRGHSAANEKEATAVYAAFRAAELQERYKIRRVEKCGGEWQNAI